MKKRNSPTTVITNITVGFQLGITIFIFVYAGHKLDVYYSKSPLFLVIGMVVGMISGFYLLMRELSNIEKQENENKKAEKEENKKRNKWL